SKIIDLGQLLKKRFVYHQAIKEDTLPTGLEKLVTNMTSDPEFCQTVIALESIQDETVRFKSQVVVLIKDALVDADISQDPYIIDILATIALKTIDYYMRTDTPFSIQREMDLLRVLNRLL
ncbi:hypothetical protein, partial [Lentilactobacillus kisonensis]|uniref:hypothetical protein n=1 Tax=Lentilactobacillus kisonensis TaxID=481722 RepID=UPI000A509F38